MLNNLKLWQTEWCPASRRVRQRLTELGLTYVVRPVPVAPEKRAGARARDGAQVDPGARRRRGDRRR